MASSGITSIINLMQLKVQKYDVVQTLIPLLNDIMNSSLSLAPVIHPLGFFHVNLGLNEQGFGLRLHLWEKDLEYDNKSYSIIHQHAWNLRSLILCGDIVNEVYQVDRNTLEPTNSIYSVHYAIDDGKVSNLLKSTGETVRATMVSKFFYDPGKYYDLDYPSYHCTSIGKANFAATLVMTEKVQDSCPQILGDLCGVDEYISIRHPIDESKFKELILQLLTKLYDND